MTAFFLLAWKCALEDAALVAGIKAKQPQNVVFDADGEVLLRSEQEKSRRNECYKTSDRSGVIELLEKKRNLRSKKSPVTPAIKTKMRH